MKNAYHYALITVIAVVYVTFICVVYTMQITTNEHPAFNNCASSHDSYELLPETASFNAMESPLTMIKLEEIIHYLKLFDQQLKLQSDIKEIVILFCHRLLEHVLQIPLANLTNKLDAEQLQKRLPDAYNYFINIVLFAESPQQFFDVISAEYELVKEKATPNIQKVVEYILTLTKTIIESPNPIDKNALTTVATISKYFICKKFDAHCCQEPGIIALLFKDSIHTDDNGLNDGVIQLLKESIKEEVDKMDIFLTQPSIIDPLSAFFKRHTTTIFTLDQELKKINEEDLSTLAAPPSQDISALLSKAENSLLLAQAK